MRQNCMLKLLLLMMMRLLMRMTLTLSQKTTVYLRLIKKFQNSTIIDPGNVTSY